MKKHHELTNLLYPFKVIEKPQQDSIIRKWLSEKSKAINADANAERTVDEILGLTDEGEKKVVCDPIHDYRYFILNRLDKCPHCGAESPVVVRPLPTLKPLVQRLAEVIGKASGGRTCRGQEQFDEYYKDMAQAALDFLREHKEEL